MSILAGRILSGQVAVRVPRDTPGKICEVRCLPGGSWRGTCPDFDYRQHDCKHIKKVRRRLAELAEDVGGLP